MIDIEKERAALTADWRRRYGVGADVGDSDIRAQPAFEAEFRGWLAAKRAVQAEAAGGAP